MAFITQRKSETYRERKRVSWSESQPLQSAQHKDSEAIYDCACRFVVFFLQIYGNVLGNE